MKVIFILLADVSIESELFGQTIPDISLNGGWELFSGSFDKNAPSNPEYLKSRNWPMIPVFNVF